MLLRKKVIRLTAWIFALMSLSLLALGLIFTQKLVSAGSPASDTRAPSSEQNEPVRPPRTPINQIAQATAPEAQPAGTEATPSARMAQTAAPSTPGANSSAQGDAQAKPTPAASNIPPCDKPGGMSLSRIVEI